MRITKPPEERKAELMQAARVLFDAKGVAHTRVSDIVKQVGVAQGVFYYYFPSKSSIVAEVAAQVTKEMDKKAHAILNGGDTFIHKLAALICLFIDLVDQFLGDDETKLDLRGAIDSGLKSPTSQSIGKLYYYLEKLIEQGVDSGDLKVSYAWKSTQAAVFGIIELAKRTLPSGKLICTILARALALPEEELYKTYLEIKNKEI